MNMPLSPAQRRDLKARAHALNPVVMIGDEGLSVGVLAEIERAIKTHELIKIRVFGTDRDQRDLLLTKICTQTGAQPVQHIGKILVVFREKPAEESKPAARRPRRPDKRAGQRRPLKSPDDDRRFRKSAPPRRSSSTSGPGSSDAAGRRAPARGRSTSKASSRLR